MRSINGIIFEKKYTLYWNLPPSVGGKIPSKVK